MKKKIFLIAALFLMGGLSICFLNSCDKDTTCRVNISVIDEGTRMPMAGVFVRFLDIDTSFGITEGLTNDAGIFATEFKAPAILNVQATFETGYDEIITPDRYYCHRDGSNTVRLKEGETVEATIVLESDIIQDLR
jgi:hypothetical protein